MHFNAELIAMRNAAVERLAPRENLWATAAGRKSLAEAAWEAGYADAAERIDSFKATIRDLEYKKHYLEEELKLANDECVQLHQDLEDKE